jgi:hypothetical protein
MFLKPRCSRAVDRARSIEGGRSPRASVSGIRPSVRVALVCVGKQCKDIRARRDDVTQ